MALESVSAAETLNQSTEDNDLEDGEIPSDEDDDEPVIIEPKKPSPEPPKPPPPKSHDSPKHSKSKKSSSQTSKDDKSSSSSTSSKRKDPSGEDWAGDVEKAIKAALDGDKSKSHDKSKSKSSSSSSNRKRSRDDKTEQHSSSKGKKKRRASEDDVTNNAEDDDEMLFVRGASPVTAPRKKDKSRTPTPRRSSSDSGDDRPARHRDDRHSSSRSNRRATKNDRTSSKSKSRSQLRSERNSRRNQNSDHNQDPDAICVYYMQGKCHRGDDCPFSHDALPPRKMELCKFYLMDCCAKRDKCLYMHHDFPCKFFHTGLKCTGGDNCKFSHEPMNEQVKNILLKHLETAPKEILGNFPRLSREGAMYMINNTEKSLAQGQDATTHKIPSLFELKVPMPPNVSINDDKDADDRDLLKERKKTRWGSDADRVPIDMVMQSASILGLASNFYGENKEQSTTNNPTNNNDEKQERAESSPVKDIDLRQLLIKKQPSEAEEDNSLIKKDSVSLNKDDSVAQEVPANLPKKTQELYMRIQQQQREAEDSFKNLKSDDEQENGSQVDWYSDDNDDDDDDDDMNNLTIVLKDKEDESMEDQENTETKKEIIPPVPLQPASIPEPAAIVDKLGDLSKIDISMEVSKLLSSIKAQSNCSKKSKEDSPEPTKESSQVTVTNVSRDPRMSRDPRQRREEQTPSKQTELKDLRTFKLETSIYSSGIIDRDNSMDVDFREKLDQDHRRKDMDLRQCFPTSTNFGDTDLRVGVETTARADIDLRQMLGLPFKPVPSHVPCTEIDATISSHPPMAYKVFLVDVPRPDYTGLKLTRNDPQVRYDPRLRKIFRLSKDDFQDSPMSPPPVSVQIPDTPKSPPLVRTDPRRKALEAAGHTPKIIPTTNMQHIQDHTNQANVAMPASYMNQINVPVQNQVMPPLMNVMPVNGPLGMNFDPRYQRNNGLGLLGAAPPMAFDSQYNNFNTQEPRNFKNDNFNNRDSDWNGQNRFNRKDRRRNPRGKFANIPRKKDMSC